MIANCKDGWGQRACRPRAWGQLYTDSCSGHSHFLMAMHICLHSLIWHNKQVPLPLLRYTDGGGGVNQGYINIMKHLKWLTHRKSAFVWLMFLELPVQSPIALSQWSGQPTMAWVHGEANHLHYESVKREAREQHSCLKGTPPVTRSKNPIVGSMSQQSQHGHYYTDFSKGTEHICTHRENCFYICILKKKEQALRTPFEDQADLELT